ncbi:alpha/beta hydrolase family protein [Roseivirga sp.]|uniref:alpha/beta hydrolase family protein n=1 Tax=Roseivirga sp. TaxID=1964215 RepID=UPI003B8D460B
MIRGLIIIVLTITTAMVLKSQEVTGDWYGELGAGARKMQFIFHISKTAEGLETTMDIPIRSLKGIKTQKTTFIKDQLHIDGKNFGFEYKGVYDSATKQMNGHMIEGPNQVPLNLKQEEIELIAKKVRPQEPIAPYPYQSEDVKFQNEKDNVTLAGTITIPNTAGKHPVAILITGSGPQNRDEEIFGHKPFLVLADHLTKLGVAVLRYDDRGVNESTGIFTDATTADFATDVESAISYLKTRNDIDVNQIGLIGHSEGGIIAPLVASKSNDVNFIVLLAGTGVSGYETSRIQARTLRGGPVPDEEAFDKFITDALDIASADGDVAEIQKELTGFYNNSPFFNAMAGDSPQKEQIVKGLVEMRTTKWIRHFYHYNPADVLEKVSCPVLSLNGTKDQQVVADINQKGIREALVKGGNKDFEVIALEGMNHFFQVAETGAMNEYDNIEETMSPKVLNLVSDWILSRVK